MSFEKDFDTLFNAVLTDWRNQFPEADTSQGSLIYIKSACLASALWGVYKHQEWIARQIFPDTADAAHMEHHAWVRGISRRAGETDAELLTRLLDDIRRPPAGGNRYDYVKWALSVDGVASAYCLPLAQGLGTVDVVILASGASEIPDQALLDAVYAYIDDVRPVTAHTLRVLPPSVDEQDVTVTVSGDDLNTTAIEADIEAYMDALEPGETLALTQIAAICVNAGADDAIISAPAANVTADADEIIRPGTISVTES